MGLLCSLFGHKPPVYAPRGWWSPGQEYARFEEKVGFRPDGTGRLHGTIISECPRCGKTFKLCRIHVPYVDRRGNILGYNPKE